MVGSVDLYGGCTHRGRLLIKIEAKFEAVGYSAPSHDVCICRLRSGTQGCARVSSSIIKYKSVTGTGF